MTRLLASLCLFVSMACMAEDQVLSSDLREPVFAAAQEALAQANDAMAHLLAPDSYSEGADAYRRAQETFKQGGKLARLESLLHRAQAAFLRAAQYARQNRDALEAAFAARLDAKAAAAEEHAPKLWREAEEAFFGAATRLESDRSESAQKYGARAEQTFREAELAAIEVSLLAGTEAAIAAAREVDADRHAPRAYAEAVRMLDEARQALASDRYDTDRPRSLATDALHHARQARYTAAMWQAVDDDDVTFEAALGVWEQELRNVAGLLDLAVAFDDGPGAAGATISDTLVELQLRKGQLETQVSEQSRHVLLLQEEVDRLQAELGGQSRAKERLQAELARQQRLKDRVRKVESMFTAAEAQVMRIEDRLVLRLVALNFASGKATIAKSHEPLLAKLIDALELFPETPIIVEGHTDAYGADLTNLDLSNRRAQAVVAYLLEGSPLSPALLSAVGYGESKPVANNETQEGRRKNRRIDVVLYPNW